MNECMYCLKTQEKMFTTIRDVFLPPRSLYIKVYTNKLKTCLNVFHMYIFFSKEHSNTNSGTQKHCQKCGIF